VFAANEFVYIPSYNSCTTFRCDQTAHWNAVATDVKDIRLYLDYTVELDPGKRLPFVRGAVIVILADLDRIITNLRLWAICTNRSIDLSLELRPYSNGEPLPVELQTKLLDPVRKFYTPRQTCSITGAVDRALANTVGTRLSPIVHWQRAELVQVLELLEEVRLRADNAYEASNMQAAADMYAAAWSCIKRLMSNNRKWDRSFFLNDTVIRDNFTFALAAIIQNLVTCRFWLQGERTLGWFCLSDLEWFRRMRWSLSALQQQTSYNLDFLAAMAAVQKRR